MPLHNDVIIIGSGLAALSAAYFLPKNLRVCIVSKDSTLACNSVLAQGGVACPTDEADIDSHIEDTLAAGAGLCDTNAVKTLITNGYELMQTLIKLGMPFDRASDGSLLCTKEAAHSRARILHASGDQTGAKLHRFFSDRACHTHHFGTVVDLLIDQNRCFGVSVLFDGECVNLYADHIVIASGGFGALYQVTTSSSAILGQLHGIASTYNIKLSDMHLTQFHPTALAGVSTLQKPLLTEALRGEGATITDESGKQFLKKYGVDELCARDRVSRAIYKHQQDGHQIYLDLSNFEGDYFAARFPTINDCLQNIGLEPPYKAVPISPAFHYAMGGIAVHLDTRVPNIDGLYAVGEAARTGVHGANRLASNSLLEALVFGRIAAQTIQCMPGRPESFRVFDTRK